MTLNLHADSLTPPVVTHSPGDRYATSSRSWQGIPGIERTSSGRLYATWYSGGKSEGPDNYVLLVHSEDNGKSWNEPELVIDPPGKVRAFDPVLWIDPLGRLWWFWAQAHTHWNGRAGVWYIRSDNPDAEKPEWTEPQWIGNGIMMNKPLVCENGEWLLPISIWNKPPCLPELSEEIASSVFVSSDQGKTFVRRGGAIVPFSSCNENMLVEKRDGSLWMLVRTSYGIGQSFSTDGGKTWSHGIPSAIAGPDSRFYISRLPSGRLLMINHVGFLWQQRTHLTASLSEDDGLTWKYFLLLDERSQVSYPDATVTSEGRIDLIYDRERYQAREILYASITEQDILAGHLVSPDSFLQRVINKVVIAG